MGNRLFPQQTYSVVRRAPCAHGSGCHGRGVCAVLVCACSPPSLPLPATTLACVRGPAAQPGPSATAGASMHAAPARPPRHALPHRTQDEDAQGLFDDAYGAEYDDEEQQQDHDMGMAIPGAHEPQQVGAAHRAPRRAPARMLLAHALSPCLAAQCRRRPPQRPPPPPPAPIRPTLLATARSKWARGSRAAAAPPPVLTPAPAPHRAAACAPPRRQPQADKWQNMQVRCAARAGRRARSA